MDKFSESFASESPPYAPARNAVETASTAGIVTPSPSINITDVSTSITMTVGLNYLVDNSAGGIVLTFPNAPNDGDNIRMRMTTPTRTTLLALGGQTFEDSSTSCFIEDNSKSYTFTYKLDIGQWILV